MGLLHSKYKTSEEKTLDLWRKSNQPTWDPNLEADSKLEADHLKKPKAEVQNLHNPSLEAASLEAGLVLEADLVWKQISSINPRLKSKTFTTRVWKQLVWKQV